MPSDLAVHELGEGRGQLGGGLVAALLGEPGIAGRGRGAERGRSVLALVQAHRLDRRLHVLYPVVGPHALLLAPVDPHEDGLHARGELGSDRVYFVQHRPVAQSGREPGHLDEPVEHPPSVSAIRRRASA